MRIRLMHRMIDQYIAESMAEHATRGAGHDAIGGHAG
jgi:hypothetical protein